MMSKVFTDRIETEYITSKLVEQGKKEEMRGGKKNQIRKSKKDRGEKNPENIMNKYKAKN